MSMFIAGIVLTLMVQSLWKRFGHHIVAEGWEDADGFHYGRRPDNGLSRAAALQSDDYLMGLKDGQLWRPVGISPDMIKYERAESRAPIRLRRGA